MRDVRESMAVAICASVTGYPPEICRSPARVALWLKHANAALAAIEAAGFELRRKDVAYVTGKPTDHASTSPGPVNCNIRRRLQGEGYPRTCERCGLGPCPFFDNDGRSKLGPKP